jgi:hypothetical protein
MTCSGEILDILSYDHGRLDSALNYLALIVTIAPVIYIHHHILFTMKKQWKYFWIVLTIGLFVFQVRDLRCVLIISLF